MYRSNSSLPKGSIFLHTLIREFPESYETRRREKEAVEVMKSSGNLEERVSSGGGCEGERKRRGLVRDHPLYGQVTNCLPNLISSP